MEIEIAMGRGVKLWWLFSFLHTLLGLLAVPTILTTTATSILLSGCLYIKSDYLTTRRPGRLTIRPLVHALAVSQGLLLFGISALIPPRSDPAAKSVVIIGVLRLLIEAAVHLQPESGKAWQLAQTWYRLPRYLRDNLVAARGINNPVMRYPALALACIPLYAFLSATCTWVAVWELSHGDLPRIRLIIRHYRLRFKFWWSQIRKQRHKNIYQHTPIVCGSTNPIRLLKIRRRNPFGDIRCELVQVDIDSKTKYEALSYTWGREKMTEPIYINGKVWLVSPTVVAVLYHLSSYRRERLIWIDSICIDQTNNAEKNQQIGLMRRIYRNANRVIIWLDDIEEPWKVRMMLAGLWHEFVYGSVESCVALIRQHSEIYPERGWIQLTEMYANAWFFRIWVVQEVAMASSVTVLAGGEPLIWEHMATVAEMLISSTALQSSNLPGVNDAFPGGVLHAFTMARFKVGRDYPQYGLMSLIGFTSNFLSTDPVDRIYALLGLLKPDDDVHLWLKPDYAKSAEDLYTFVAQNLIFEDCNEILSCAGIGYDRALKDLPSWVPDWTMPSNGQTDCQHFTKIQQSARYNASAGSTLSATVGSRNHQGQTALNIQGHRCGRITHTSPVMTYTEHNRGEDASASVVRTIFEAHMHARRLATQFARTPYPTGQTIEEAFWRCLVGDTQFQRPAPAVLGVFCRLWEAIFERDVDQDVKENFREELSELAGMDLLAELGLTDDAVRCGLSWNSCRIMCCIGRALAITDAGYLAMVPPGARAGDWVCLLYGLNTPFVLRPLVEGVEGQGEPMSLIGEAYVHGMMDGEAMWPGEPAETFVIF